MSINARGRWENWPWLLPTAALQRVAPAPHLGSTAELASKGVFHPLIIIPKSELAKDHEGVLALVVRTRWHADQPYNFPVPEPGL